MSDNPVESLSSVSFGTVLGSILCAALGAFLLNRTNINQTKASEGPSLSVGPTDKSIRVAFLGNSILYFNDCPRLVEPMLKKRFKTVHQDSCLRGGATLPSLLQQGNGMRTKFATPAAARPDGSFDIGAPTVAALLQQTKANDDSQHAWDVIVMNDHTQAPAREKSRQATIHALRNQYAPLIQQSSPSAIVVLVQTAAYRYPNVNNSDDLGTFQAFTQKLIDGYSEYAAALQSTGMACRIAPVGQAFALLYKTNPSLWNQLYHTDDYHYSPHGTWLEACVIYATMTNAAPPVYNGKEWWSQCRRMQPENEPPLPRPTRDEAELLQQVAMQVCGIFDAT